MPWWGWIVVGAALLGSELIADAQFYLVFLGVSAVAVGLIGLAGPQTPIWLQWLLFGGIAMASLMTFRGRLYNLIRAPAVEGEVRGGVLGERVVVQEAIGPGASGRAELRGSVWTAHNVGERALAEGAAARVERVEGLRIYVRPED